MTRLDTTRWVSAVGATLVLLHSIPAFAEDDLYARDVGDARIRLIDIGLGVLATGGSSTVDGETLERLQGGAHDPRQRGFTLNQLELSFQGAVDPFFDAAAYLVFQIDDEGETTLEVEEASVTSQRLPFGLDGLGFQVEVGQMFTEFGRNNPTHPHSWATVDQPFVVTRFLGGDGQRAPGIRVGWLTPLPWFSELHVGMQNAKGETLPSFLANDEVFEERPIGGRPLAYDSVHGLNDFVYLLRLVNAFELGDEWSTQIGASALLGPNATGPDGQTRIFGLDVVAKWRPLRTDRGWPFLTLTAEAMHRDYQADGFRGVLDVGGAPLAVAIPSDRLQDTGLYVEGVWGFSRGFSAGLRYGFGTGSGAGYDETGARVPRNVDPERSTRQRVSPFLVFDPSEYSRLRLQYDYDRAKHLSGHDAHSVWIGVEVSLGAHQAHAY